MLNRKWWHLWENWLKGIYSFLQSCQVFSLPNFYWLFLQWSHTLYYSHIDWSLIQATFASFQNPWVICDWCQQLPRFHASRTWPWKPCHKLRRSRGFLGQGWSSIYMIKPFLSIPPYQRRRLCPTKRDVLHHQLIFTLFPCLLSLFPSSEGSWERGWSGRRCFSFPATAELFSWLCLVAQSCRNRT